MILENINYFQEVVSPLYAFPVVGVVLCALLVFAFGFKTPAQPPSFDFVENRKVVVKKKTKSKDIKTPKPVQNGSAHASDSTSSSIPAKTQNAKPVKTETPVTKKNVSSETKSKTKKQDVPNSEKTTTKSEANEEVTDNVGFGEWTQQLSRKERKNKKGKDVGVNLKNTINLLTTSPKVIKSKELKTPPEDKEEAEEAKNVDDQKSKKNIENKENIDENEFSEDKENIQMKEKSSSDDLTAKDVSQDEQSSKKSKKKKKDGAQVPILEQPPSENKADAPETKSTKETSKKAKKSAKAGNKTQNTDSIEIKELAAEMQIEALPKKVTEPDLEKPLATPAASEPAVVESPKEEEEDSAKPTSNVVFDELGDMWQDAKPQKKKKKARRE